MRLDQIQDLVKQEKIVFLYLQFSDFFGQIKNVVAPVEKLADIVEGGAWFDGSSIEGFARIAESDMYLKPDLSTFAIIPWSDLERKAARLICDIYQANGRRFQADPRFILQKIINKARKMDLDYLVGAEFEFYLIEREFLPQLKPHDDKSYFDYTPHSRAFLICESTMNSLSAFSIKSETHHHEVGNGQHEIDLHYDNAVKTADNVVALKMALKAYTANTELKATWMSKPIFGSAGNGMHIHQSLWRQGKNFFYDQNNRYGLSKTAIHFLAGQLAHAKALSALVSPTVNSYKRLVPGFEAPVYICWGRNNRSALIRIPLVAQEKANVSTRLEYRAPDPSANSYLIFAALLAAGLDGIERQLEPPVAIEENAYSFDSQQLIRNHINTLPTNLGEAIEALRDDRVIIGILGNAQKRFLEIKEDEWRQFSIQVTPWEIDKYL